MSKLSRLAIALTALALLIATPALAQVTAVKAPLTNIDPQDMMPGTSLWFCPGSFGPPMDPTPIPLEWEVVFKNDGDSPVTLSYQDAVQDGYNGAALSLNCPPTQLPPGVMATDVNCDDVGHNLTVDNITVQPCESVVLRFETVVDNMAVTLDDICNGAEVNDGTNTFRTVPGVDDQVPSPPPTPSDADDSCVYSGQFCNISDTSNLRLYHSFTADNGAPLLPGDFVTFRIHLDLRYIPVAQLRLRELFIHQVGEMLAPLPTGIEFVAWLDKPLEAAGAEYRNTPGREVSIVDPDLTDPMEIFLAAGQIHDLGTWQAQVNCGTGSGDPQCVHSLFTFESIPPLYADDPNTYGAKNDATCVTPTHPGLPASTKTVQDSDTSGDAQPGELLTFIIDVNNGLTCPDPDLSCGCRGTNIEVTDIVDLTYIENIVPLDGGVFTPPDRIDWSIPLVDAGDVQQVRFQANVKTDAMDGDMICNTATMTADELKSTTDGGLLENCPTTSVSVDLDPCIEVVIVPGPALGLSKAITDPPTGGPYGVGSTLTFSLDVQNIGTGDATNVEVWDCLGPCFDSSLINPLDGGVLNGGTDPGCGGSDWIRWSIPTLAASSSQTVRFEATLPLDIADLTTCDNTAEVNSTEVPTAVPSPQLQFDVCAPVLQFEKTLPKAQYGETERIEWTITLTNNGSCDATGLQVTDTLDFTLLDESTLMYTDPPGSTSSFVSPTITWDLQPLPSAGSQSWTVSAVTATGQAPTTICNTADLSWDQGSAPIVTDPPSGTCAEVLSGMCAPLEPIPDLFAVNNAGDVDMTWSSTAAPDGYRVCFVDGFANRSDIMNTCDSAGTGICDPTAVEMCSHTAAMPTDVFYYQAKGLCGANEGP